MANRKRQRPSNQAQSLVGTPKILFNINSAKSIELKTIRCSGNLSTSQYEIDDTLAFVTLKIVEKSLSLKSDVLGLLGAATLGVVFLSPAMTLYGLFGPTFLAS